LLQRKVIFIIQNKHVFYILLRASIIETSFGSSFFSTPTTTHHAKLKKKKLLSNSEMTLLTCQTFAYVLCIYFIPNDKNYEIKLNLLITSSINEKVNGLLAVVRTFIFVIPLIIISLANIIPENKKLTLISNFFGITSVVGVLKLGLTSLTVEIFNAKILTLEEKRIIFKTEFIRILEKYYINSFDLYNLLQKYINDSYFIIYDKQLIGLTNNSSIRDYAKEVIKDLLLAIQNEQGFVTLAEDIIYNNVALKFFLIYYAIIFFVITCGIIED
jgi:hypothetical protein